MSEQKAVYTKVVYDSLIEKGYMPLANTMWTYYARDIFKPILGLTWFNGQWWCKDTHTHQRLVAICNDLDQLFSKHLSQEEFIKLKNRKNW